MRFNPHYITEQVKSLNIGRGVDCAKVVMSKTGLLEGLNEDSFIKLFDASSSKLCCARVGYKNHLANILLREERGVLINVYTSRDSLRIGGNR